MHLMMTLLYLLFQLSMAWIVSFSLWIFLVLSSTNICALLSLPLVLMPPFAPIWMVVLGPLPAHMLICSGIFACIWSLCVFLPCKLLRLAPIIQLGRAIFVSLINMAVTCLSSVSTPPHFLPLFSLPMPLVANLVALVGHVSHTSLVVPTLFGCIIVIMLPVIMSSQ